MTGNASEPQRLGTPKADFLESVRQGLKRRPGAPEPPYSPLQDDVSSLEEEVRRVRTRIAGSLPALLDKLSEVASDRGWQVCRAPGPEKAIGYIQSLDEAFGNYICS